MKNLLLSVFCSVAFLQGAQVIACDNHAAKAGKCEGKSARACGCGKNSCADGQGKNAATQPAKDKVISSSASPKK